MNYESAIVQLKWLQLIESFVKIYTRSFNHQLELKGNDFDEESDNDLV